MRRRLGQGEGAGGGGGAAAEADVGQVQGAFLTLASAFHFILNVWEAIGDLGTGE